MDTGVTDATDSSAGSGLDEGVRALFERANQDPVAREELIGRYHPLAKYLAGRFEGRGEPLEDLVQVASLGLVKAVDRFDLGREVSFSTYATATIVGELKRHFRDRAWAVRVPRQLQEATLRVNRAVSDLSQELGRSPTVDELARRTGQADEQVLEAMEAVQAYSAGSLDAPGTDEQTALDRLGSEDESLELMEGWASIAPLLRTLPTRERRILHLRFFQGKSQSSIAEEVGLSQMHVSRLLSSTLAKLRAAATGDSAGT